MPRQKKVPPSMETLATETTKRVKKKYNSVNVEVPVVSQPKLIVPEYFATPTKKGYKLINPLTQERNLAKRGGETSIRIIQKPIKDMVLLEGNAEPIPITLFGKKDREKLIEHHKLLTEHSNKPIEEVPVSIKKPVKERGRPEKLPKNIKINLERKAEKEPKRRGRKTTLTNEERLERQREQKKEWARKERERKKAEATGGNIISEAFKNMGKDITKAFKSGKKTATTIVYGASDYSPKVRHILADYGNKKITGITIGRTPVSEALTKVLSSASSQFKQNLENSPYDTLFHLFILVKLEGAGEVRLEKNEVINADLIRKGTPDTDYKEVKVGIPNITLNEMLEKAKNAMGNQRFFGYSARDFNCQDFIIGIFNANNIGDSQDREFIKQDTKSLFNDTGFLRKFANTITDLGAKVNALTTGGRLNKKGVIKQYGKMLEHLTEHIKDPIEKIDPKDYKQSKELINNIKNIKLGDLKNKISGKSIMPKFAKGSKEAKEFMASIRRMKGKGRKKKEEESDSDSEEEMEGGTLKSIVDKSVRKARELSGYGLTIKDLVDRGHKLSKSDITLKDLADRGYDEGRKLSGYGVHHHHYHIGGQGVHYHMSGKGAFDFLDPKKNGVAKAFSPVERAFTKDIPKAFAPAEKVITRDIPSDLIHKALPATIGTTVGGLTTLATGNPYVGGIAGATGGAYLGKMAGDELGRKTGYGFKKGSQEAKDHMAKIRAMRKKK